MFIGMNLSIIGQLLGSAAAIDASYRIGSFSPKLVLDFTNEYYRTGGALTTFDSALTATRAGNATMVDSDGLIKWAPHNLLTYSESMPNRGLTGGSAPDAVTFVENSASSLHRFGTSSITAISGVEYTIEMVVVTSPGRRIYANAGALIGCAALFDTSTGTRVSTSGTYGSQASISANGDGTYTVVLRGIGTGATNPVYVQLSQSSWSVATDETYTGDGASSLTCTRIHAYRSDLGGMVNNPDRGDSYVPTTSAARYLPRRGHHVYNGYEWVNEGLLVESEARTNLITYSEASVADWLTSGATRTQLSGSYLGAFAGVRVTSAGADWNRLETTDLSWTSGQTYNLTFFYVAGTSGRARLNLRDNTAGTESRANGPIGAVVAGIVNAGTVTNVTTETLPGGVYKTTYTFVPNNTTNIGRVGIGPDSNTSGEDIIALGAQLEAGSTPSSYIPTAGATVTRAAETLVIPSANLPWPAPQYVTGTELVTNGDFSDGATGWTLGNEWAIVDGALKLTSTSSDYRATQQLNIPVTAGKVYAFKFDVLDVTSIQSGDFRVILTANPGGTQLVNTDTIVTTGAKEFYAVIPSGATSVAIVLIGTTSGEIGDSITIDNISVKEINPLAVSIAMDGRMTYADTGVVEEAIPVRWSSATEYVTTRLRTDTTRTGAIQFLQKNTVTEYQVISGATVYTPGVNVPFNIASRHGSTFLNGAVDGVALTADLTPTSLPNLSTSNLQLGYTFMGTIGSFRIWADDIGDAGLVTATNPSTEPSLMLTFDSAETSFVDLGWSE